MIELRLLWIQNMWAPYRQRLFEAVQSLDGVETAAFVNRAIRPEKDWAVDETYGGIPVYHGSHYKRIGPIEYAAGLNRAISDFRPTHIIAAGWNLLSAWQAMWAARRREITAVAWVETSAATINRTDRLTTKVRKVFVQQADMVLVPGAQVSRYVEALDSDSERVLFPNAVADDNLCKLPAPVDQSGVLFLGELTERKGFDVFLAALPQLAANHNIHIAGTGAMQQRLEDRLVDLSSEERSRVHVHGYVTSMTERRALFEQCHVLALPSRRDPWPLAAVEALAAGRGVVLGPGVGSAEDLVSLAPDAVRTATLDVDSLVRSVAQLSQPAVPSHLRCTWNAEQLAAQLVEHLRNRVEAPV